TGSIGTQAHNEGPQRIQSFSELIPFPNNAPRNDISDVSLGKTSATIAAKFRSHEGVARKRAEVGSKLAVPVVPLEAGGVVRLSGRVGQVEQIHRVVFVLGLQSISQQIHASGVQGRPQLTLRGF